MKKRDSVTTIQISRHFFNLYPDVGNTYLGNIRKMVIFALIKRYNQKSSIS